MGKKKKKYSSPKITTIHVRNAAEFLTKSVRKSSNSSKKVLKEDERNIQLLSRDITLGYGVKQKIK